MNKCLNWRKRKRFFLLGCCQLLVQGVFAGTKLFVFELTTASSSACCCWHPSNLKILLFTVMMSYFNSILYPDQLQEDFTKHWCLICFGWRKVGSGNWYLMDLINQNLLMDNFNHNFWNLTFFSILLSSNFK